MSPTDMNSAAQQAAADPISAATARGYYRRSWNILGVAWMVYFVDVFMRYNIPTVIPLLRKEYHWRATTVGWVDSSYLWAYGLTQVPWGYISEKYLGAKWTVTVGTAMIAVASVVFAFDVQSLTLGILARAVIGVGAAAIWVPLNPALARWFAPQRRGMQTGILGSASSFGTLVGGAAMPILVTNSVALFGLSPLQSGFLWSAIPGIVMMLVVPLVILDAPEKIGLVSLDAKPATRAGSAAKDELSFGKILCRSGYPYLISLVYAGYLGSLYFVWTWFAAYLGQAYHVNLRSAGLLWAVAATLPALVSQPVGGFLSDRIGRVRAVAGSLLMTFLIAGLFTLVAKLGPAAIPAWLVVALAMLFSVFVNMWVLIWPFTTVMFSTSAGGPIGGLMNTFAQLIGAAAPVISGMFIDTTGSYVPVFAAGCVCALVGFVASLFLKDYRVV